MGHDGEVPQQRRSPLRWVLLLLVFAAVAVATFFALLREDTNGVRRAGSAATLPIPSLRSVRLDARAYAISYGDVAHAVLPRLSALHLSIRPADGGPALPFREPVKRQIVTAEGRTVIELHFIAVGRAGDYDVAVTSDEPTSGSLLIGDSATQGPWKVFRAWLVLVVVGGIAAFVLIFLSAARTSRR